jgi:nucleoside-diphosphate-sugar epimerase
MDQRSCGRSRRVVAITGATGFVGRRLANRHLDLGDSVRILTRNDALQGVLPEGSIICRGNLNGDPVALKKFVADADILYHCAAELRDPGRMQLVNVAGTRNLAEAAAGRVRHWVQLSSVAVYGRQPAGMVCEATPANEANTYATSLTKLESERVVMGYAASGAFTCTILRPCKIYGKDMPDAALRNLAGYIRRGLFFFVGKPGAAANYVHVDNVVDALLLCATHEAAPNRAFNVCDGFTMEELVAVLAHNMGCPVPRARVSEWLARVIAELGCRLSARFPLNEVRIAGLTNRTIYSTDAIRQQLGYRTRVSLEDGVAELVRAMQQTRA